MQIISAAPLPDRFFVSAAGEYYISKFAEHALDVEVGQRPSLEHQLVGGAWVLDPAAAMAKLEAELSAAVQGVMDAKAIERGYDSIFTAVTYADEPAVAKFQLEGLAFRKWRSQCWDFCYQRLSAVQAGKATAPTLEELLASLPAIALP